MIFVFTFVSNILPILGSELCVTTLCASVSSLDMHCIYVVRIISYTELHNPVKPDLFFPLLMIIDYFVLLCYRTWKVWDSRGTWNFLYAVGNCWWNRMACLGYSACMFFLLFSSGTFMINIKLSLSNIS